MHANRFSNRAAYYNEFDPYAAQWLRNLISAGHLPPGDVDERSICDVSPDDLIGYGACHFFAGIGGWPFALRMAGIPDDANVWTGSCPCQPFSAAGKQKGKEDERHLWPVFRDLIAARVPECVFGEQVATAVAHGWADDLQADLEAQGYAVGYAVLGAHSVGAPHVRQRIYWGGRLADAAGARRSGSLPDTESPTRGKTRVLLPCSVGATGGVSDAGFWPRAKPHLCRDGKHRLVEPGVFPLADGVPARVGRLRAYGNAIVPQVAAAFAQAMIEATQ